jgi:hypothetical protein
MWSVYVPILPMTFPDGLPVGMREAKADGSRQAAAPGATVAASHREAGDFAEIIERLQDAVRAACAGQTEWQAKIGRGVQAVLDFIARDPVAGRELTDRGEGQGGQADAVIAYFSELLGRAAPGGRPYGVSTDQAIVESLAGVVRAHLRAGTTDRLPGMAPGLILLTLLPYSGSGAVGVAAGPAASGAVL